jgi:hypothetical protein
MSAPLEDIKCNDCNLTKPTTDFGLRSNSKTGRSPRCKCCVNARAREARARLTTRSQEEINRKLEKKHGCRLVDVRLSCSCCNKRLPVSCFSSNPSHFRGYRYECIECQPSMDRASTLAYQQRTPEQVLVKRTELHPTGTKRCAQCERDVSLEYFNTNNTKADGLSTQCSPCDLFDEQQHRRALKKIRDEARSGGCEKCGFNGDPSALDFAHHNRDEKYRNSSGKPVDPGRITSIPALLAEIPKTKVLCANCHM